MINRPGFARTRTLLATGAVLAGLCACTSNGGPADIVTVTVHRTPTPTATSTSSPSGSVTSTAAKPSSTPRRMTKLPGTCDSLLPTYSILTALGGGRLGGKEAFVVGKPDPGIGRLGYINCRYGVAGAAHTPKVEIGVSLYRTAAHAGERVQATVDDYTAHAAHAAGVTVTGHHATLLTRGAGAGYSVPLLVVAAGQRTVAVSIASSLATGKKLVEDARTLASLALRKTAGRG